MSTLTTCMSCSTLGTCLSGRPAQDRPLYYPPKLFEADFTATSLPNLLSLRISFLHNIAIDPDKPILPCDHNMPPFLLQLLHKPACFYQSFNPESVFTLIPRRIHEIHGALLPHLLPHKCNYPFPSRSLQLGLPLLLCFSFLPFLSRSFPNFFFYSCSPSLFCCRSCFAFLAAFGFLETPHFSFGAEPLIISALLVFPGKRFGFLGADYSLGWGWAVRVLLWWGVCGARGESIVG